MTAKSIDELLKSAKKIRQSKNAAYTILNRYTREGRAVYDDAKIDGAYDNLRHDQLEKLGHECPVCSVEIDFHRSSIDHMNPISRYFHLAQDTKNMLVMCKSCNGRKGAQEFKSWFGKLPRFSQKSMTYAIAEIHGQTRLEELISK